MIHMIFYGYIHKLYLRIIENFNFSLSIEYRYRVSGLRIGIGIEYRVSGKIWNRPTLRNSMCRKGERKLHTGLKLIVNLIDHCGFLKVNF